MFIRCLIYSSLSVGSISEYPDETVIDVIARFTRRSKLSHGFPIIDWSSENWKLEPEIGVVMRRIVPSIRDVSLGSFHPLPPCPVIGGYSLRRAPFVAFLLNMQLGR